MTFNDDAQLDTSQVGGGGGGGGFRPGGMVVGGGGGCLSIIVLVVVLFFNGTLGGSGGGDDGGDTSGTGDQGGTSTSLDRGDVSGGGSVNQNAFDNCRTGADANRDDTCRVVATVNSVQDYWKSALPEQSNGRYQYRSAKTILYDGQTQSACGTASNQVGPFYCPLDRKVYIDASFFKLLSSQYGADGGALAQEYVVAHEYGHSIQDQLGLLDRAQQDPEGASSGGVRTELMADCLAGMWAKNAATTKDANGRTLLKPLTQSDIDSALSAASAVGDDRIQEKARGRVSPESFTHGTSKQRQRWFMTGYQKGSLNACNTYDATSL